MIFFKRLKNIFINSDNKIFIFLLSLSFYSSLLLANSNKIYLSLTLAYLIILFIKLHNWRLSLLLTVITILPFIRGKNLLEITLINKEKIWGYSLYDVKYYWPIYLGDAFLLLIYQSYFSKTFFKKNKKLKLSKSFKFSMISIFIILLAVASKGIRHQFAAFMIFSSFLILKYLFLYISPLVIESKNKFKLIESIIAASISFQSIIILFEQIKGGNLRKFIENSSVENLGTSSAEEINLLRANGTFDEANIAAMFLLMGVSIILPSALKSLKKNSFHYYLPVTAFAILAIILTGSRSIYFISLIYVSWQTYKNWSLIKKHLIKIWHFNFLKILVFITIIIISPYLIRRIKSLPDALNPNGSFSYRLELNRHVLLLGGEKPLLGIGLDMTPYYLTKTYKAVDSPAVIFDQAPAHNIFIQLFAETGIIGLTSFILMIYFVTRKIISRKKWQNNEFFIAACIFLLGAQLHPVFSNHSELTGFFFLFLGLALNLAEIKNNDQK